MNIEKQIEQAIKELGDNAYKKFFLQVSEYGKLKQISSVNFKSNDELLDSVGKYLIIMKPLTAPDTSNPCSQFSHGGACESGRI